MYTVSKQNGRTMIHDWKGELVYSALDDAIVLYDKLGHASTAKVGDLTPEQLLLALKTGLKLPL